MMIYKWKIK